MPTKRTTVLGKDSLNALHRKNSCEGKPFAGEKSINDFLKAAAATLGGIWY